MLRLGKRRTVKLLYEKNTNSNKFQKMVAKIAFAGVLVISFLTFLLYYLFAQTIAVFVIMFVLLFLFANAFLIMVKSQKQVRRLEELAIIFSLIFLASISFMINQDFLPFLIVLSISSIPILIGLTMIFRSVTILFWQQVAISFTLVQLAIFLKELYRSSLIGVLPIVLLIVLLLWFGLSENKAQKTAVTLLVIGVVNAGLGYYFFRQTWVSIFNLLPVLLIIFAYLSIIYSIKHETSRKFLALIWSGIFFMQTVAPYFPPGSGSLILIAGPLFLLINICLIFILLKQKNQIEG